MTEKYVNIKPFPRGPLAVALVVLFAYYLAGRVILSRPPLHSGAIVFAMSFGERSDDYENRRVRASRDVEHVTVR